MKSFFLCLFRNIKKFFKGLFSVIKRFFKWFVSAITFIKPILYCVLCGAMVISVCVASSFAFKHNYYSSIYVSGQSMEPTLHGEKDNAHYGIVDKSYGALKSLKRWQIVTTHYPNDDRLMIKRVLFLPGDTFKVTEGDMFLGHDNNNDLIFDESEWEKIEPGFDRVNNNTSFHNYPATTLKDDEYFLAGDNWDNSLDSFEKGPISFEYLVGVVVEIQGTCKIVDDVPVDKIPYDKPLYFLGVDF